MDFKINQIDFEKVVSGVMPAVGSEGKSDIKSFRYLQVTATDGAVTFAATNGEVILKSTVVADVAVKGCIGVTGKQLADIVALLPSGNVHVLIAGENRLQIRAGRTALHLPIIPGDAFPVLPEYEKMNFLPINDFFKDFGFVSFAASKDQTRPQLCGVCLNQEELVATDGHRLSVRKIPWQLTQTSILSADNINKVKRMFPDQSVGIHIGPSDIHFSQEGRFATVRLLSGQYIDYVQVLPKAEFLPAVIKVSALQDVLKILAVVADEQKNVSLNFKQGALYLLAESAAKGKAEDTIAITCDTEMSIGMNADYLKQALDNTEAEEVLFELRGSMKPLVIRDGKTLHVIMPKRIAG